MRKISGILVLVILLTQVSGAPSSSSWIISPGYIQAYSHKYELSWDNGSGMNSIGTESYTPMYFYIWSVSNKGYSYLVRNHSSTYQTVAIVESKYEERLYDLVRGDLPIVLPTEYKGHSDWVEMYFSSLADLRTKYPYVDPFLRQLVIDDLATDIEGSAQLLMTDLYFVNTLGSILNPYLQILNVVFNLKQTVMNNANMTMKFSYIKRSGILKDLEFSIRADKGMNVSTPMLNISLYFRMVFAITVPPLNSESISVDPVPAVLAIPFLLAVTRRTRRLPSPSSSDGSR